MTCSAESAACHRGIEEAVFCHCNASDAARDDVLGALGGNAVEERLVPSADLGHPPPGPEHLWECERAAAWRRNDSAAEPRGGAGGVGVLPASAADRCPEASCSTWSEPFQGPSASSSCPTRVGGCGALAGGTGDERLVPSALLGQPPPPPPIPLVGAAVLARWDGALHRAHIADRLGDGRFMLLWDEEPCWSILEINEFVEVAVGPQNEVVAASSTDSSCACGERACFAGSAVGAVGGDGEDSRLALAKPPPPSPPLPCPPPRYEAAPPPQCITESVGDLLPKLASGFPFICHLCRKHFGDVEMVNLHMSSKDHVRKIRHDFHLRDVVRWNLEHYRSFYFGWQGHDWQ